MQREAESGESVIWPLLQLIRPKQWIKNSFVLAPLVFTGLFTDLESITLVCAALLLFCIASATVYIVNDLHDREMDRSHPQNRHARPLASGAVKPKQAITLLVVLYLMLTTGFLLSWKLMLVICAYMLLNLAYTYYLKQQPILDIFSIASGFVLRVYAGAVILTVPVSEWMFITTLCLALYLAAMKRRAELMLENSARTVLKYYSVPLIERFAQMSATGALVFYSMFVMSERSEMIMTIPLVLFGLFRYWLVVESSE